MATRHQIEPFTGLRAIAAWAVVFYHYAEGTADTGAWARIFSRGYYAVDLFFIMSGFVIALRYQHILAADLRLRRWAWFMLLRIGRIYPLHLAVLLLYLSVPLALTLTGRPIPENRFPLGYFLQSLVLIQNWGFSRSFSWNLPAWSISTELAFYLLFPLIAAAVAPFAGRRAGLLVLGVIAVGWVGGMGWLLGRLVFHTPQFGVLRCVSECLLGVWLFNLSRLAPPGPAAALALIIASLTSLTAYTTAGLPDYIAIPVAFACLLLAVTEPTNALSRALCWPVLTWLGTLSFSTYLLHYLVKDWTKLLLVGRVPSFAMLPCFIAAVLAGSWLMHRVVEEPGRRRSRRLADAWLSAGALPSTPSPPVAPKPIAAAGTQA